MDNRYPEIIKFIRSQYNQQENFIPLHEPSFIGNEKKYVVECIDSTFVSSVGEFVDRLEEKVAAYTGAVKAVACVNGTNALHMALKLACVDSGDEVITQSLSFIATCNAISYCGAHPVFIDVDADTMGMSPASLKAFLENEIIQKQNKCYNRKTGRKISACVPMHTFGHPCQIDEIAQLCDDYNITLIEDAAESIGSLYKGKHTGTYGKIGVLSFNGNKIITTGGGGVMIFNDEELAGKAKHLTTQAKVPHRWEFVHDAIGYNYRMPNINAALGVAQLENLDLFLNFKRELAGRYDEFFKSIGMSFFTEPENAKSNYWLNVVLVENRTERDVLLKYLNDNGIMARPIWKLMNELEMFKNCQAGDLVSSKWFSDRVINIPSSYIPDYRSNQI